MWCNVLLLLCASLFANATVLLETSSDWAQQSLTKTLELGGSVSRLSIEATATPTATSKDGEPLYFNVFLSGAEYAALSSASIDIEPAKGAQGGSESLKRLTPSPNGLIEGANTTYSVGVEVPRSATNGRGALKFTFSARLLHVSSPMPAAVPQNEQPLLLWRGDAEVRTPYATKRAEFRVKCPTAKVEGFTPADGARAAGSTITYGPFEEVKPFTEDAVARAATVHYAYNRAIITYVDYERHVEISTSGDNIATHDRIWMRNDGPKLLGHFSRSKYMMTKYTARSVPGIVEEVPLTLPPGARDVYFIDDVGNVTTSALTRTAADSKMPTRLDLTPRYPIYGGWNYTYMVGWNNRLSEGGIAKQVGPNRLRVAFPFLTATRNAAIDHASVRIVLPEGAKNVNVYFPYDMDEVTDQTFATYLDTVGRPAYVLRRSKCSATMSGDVYVEFTLSPMDQLRKPVVVTLAALTIFATAAVLRRLPLGVPSERKVK